MLNLTQTASPIDHGSHKDHPLIAIPLEKLGNRGGFPGERGLVGRKIDGLEKPGIGGDFLSHSQKEDVAGNQLLGIDFDLLPIADYPHSIDHQFLQGRNRVFRPVLLDKTETGIENHNRQNDDRVQILTDKKGEDRGDHQDYDQKTLKLGKENFQRENPRAPGQNVGAKLRQPLPCFCRG
ncbi:MAG: hypothetical protein VF00_C0017G0006 [candidate division Kazan bacterium GW2011_GWB1_52_7]|uniref:Uncharacterized protein n=1 Tax=candidate division Kazan bacterium GW2011_GWB1_52_7 TaxID=1620414 RepID=A0A0G1X5Q2_UNCK3|nr:MAG: hypothetical protein VF00_C0017G0006 [candidate division Kazan bacterium GW2011_GWB1_52_7]